METMASLPYSIDFRPTGACNLQCPFCFGPRHDLKTMSTDDMLKVVESARRYGTKAVVVSGGEPTLVRDLPVILNYMKSYGLHIVMSTNGILFEDRMDEIAPFLDWVVLPIDASSVAVDSEMRVGYPQHLGVILDLIPKIRYRYPLLKIKIGTVVSKINKDSVANIPEILSPHAFPDLWKLYQVTYRNYGWDNRELLEISDGEFEHVVLLAQKSSSSRGIPLTVRRNYGRDGTHLFINPTGDVAAIRHDEEIVIGNVLIDLEGVLKTIHEFIDEEKLRRNFESNYPLLLHSE